MARPKKIGDSVAVSLVDGLYARSGDPKRLKFTELEVYAASAGIEVKAYDLRRNQAVLRRIAEIEALSLKPDTLSALAYKNLDIDGFIKTNKTPAKLKQALSELDERWRKLYDYTVSLFEQVRGSAEELRIAGDQVKTLEAEHAVMSEKLRDATGSSDSLKKENAYLRKMVREYLYPAIADKILQTPGAEYSSTTQSAADAMIDDCERPDSFSESAAADQQLRSREDILFEKLRKRARGDYAAKT